MLIGEDPIDMTIAQGFLDQVSLQIDTSLLSQVKAHITEQEISKAISTLANGKAPGPEGYTPEFYKMSVSIAVPVLVKVYQKILSGGEYLPSRYQAHIKLIAKKGNDPTEPSSYRPISLLNLDSKILSKVKASRLAKIMPSFINPSQAGFTQGHSASSKICKVITALERAKANPNSDNAIISLNVEKAFNNINFAWLSLGLCCFGFSGSFFKFGLNYVFGLYRKYCRSGTHIRQHQAL